MHKFIVIIFVLLLIFSSVTLARAETIRDIEFPIRGDYQPFGDSYGDPRSSGRTHIGIDILAPKMTSLVAAADGRVTFAPETEPSWGYALYIKDDEGWSYRYLHINNDTPGTDDGAGGFTYAFAPGIERGVEVQRGQLVAYVGDSGNAEKVTSHLHFEIHQPDDTPINPYPSLLAALNGGAAVIDYNPNTARESAISINVDKSLTSNVTGSLPCEPNSLIKSIETTAVYYCGADGRRYVFPNNKTYFTWYDNFSNVQTVTPEVLASLPLGGNVTYRPGVKLVKITTDPKVYAVDSSGMLRWVVSPEIAQTLYGEDWANWIDDIPDTFFINYRIGAPLG